MLPGCAAAGGTGKVGAVHLAQRTEVGLVVATSPETTATKRTFLVRVLLGTGAAAVAATDDAAAAAQRTVPTSVGELR